MYQSTRSCQSVPIICTTARSLQQHLQYVALSDAASLRSGRSSQAILGNMARCADGRRVQGFHPDDFQRDRRGGGQGPPVHPDMMQPGPTGRFDDSMFS